MTAKSLIGAVVGVLLAITQAGAMTYNIDYSVGDPPGPTIVSFTIDTSAAPVVVMPASGFPNGDTWAYALYGYNIAAISDFSFSYGGITYSRSNVVDRVPEAGFTAAVWFSGPLADGANLKTWMYLSGVEDDVEFGGGACGYTIFSGYNCLLLDQAMLRNVAPMNVSISSTPLPAALPLFATGLGALGLLARRRKRKSTVLAAA